MIKVAEKSYNWVLATYVGSVKPPEWLAFLHEVGALTVEQRKLDYWIQSNSSDLSKLKQLFIYLMLL